MQLLQNNTFTPTHTLTNRTESSADKGIHLGMMQSFYHVDMMGGRQIKRPQMRAR